MDLKIRTKAEKQAKQTEVMKAYLEGVRNERLRVMNTSKGVTWCEAPWCRQPKYHARLQLVYYYQAQGEATIIVEDLGEISPRHLLMVCPPCRKEIESRPDWVKPPELRVTHTG